ncbi:MAG: ribosome biogenesis GTPase YqeH [Anaeroplasmataceae bacterium]
MKKYKCIGCGSFLQDTNKDQKGYVPLVDKTLDLKENIYCKRCFRLKNYNERPKILATSKDYEFVVDELLKKKGLIVLIVDIFDFHGTFIPEILKKLRGRRVLLVANKFDLLPKSSNITKVVSWLSSMCNKVFFKVDAIHVVSSKKGYYIDDLMNTIDLLRNEQDVYFVGCANVGKSSLINALLKRFTHSTTDLISTSEIPGTTIDSINIPFFYDNQSLIDTPGLINEKNVIHQLLPESYKYIIPTKEIKPITYQIKNDNSILISGLFIISLVESTDVSFTCYFSDRLLVHRTKTENVDNLLEKHLGGMLNPPTLDEVANVTYTELEFDIKGNKRKDIVISGLGFITPNKPCKVKVKVIKNAEVFVRDAIIGN